MLSSDSWLRSSSVSTEGRATLITPGGRVTAGRGLPFSSSGDNPGGGDVWRFDHAGGTSHPAPRRSASLSASLSCACSGLLAETPVAGAARVCGPSENPLSLRVSPSFPCSSSLVVVAPSVDVATLSLSLAFFPGGRTGGPPGASPSLSEPSSGRGDCPLACPEGPGSLPPGILRLTGCRLDFDGVGTSSLK